MKLRVAKKIMDGRRARRRRRASFLLAGRRLARAAGRGTRLLPPGLRRPGWGYLVDYGSGLQPARNLGEWAIWVECFPLRQVALTKTAKKTVSTVLLADCTVDLGGPRDVDLYESAWWDTGEDGERGGEIEPLRRYATKREALEGHARLVKLVRKEIQ